MKDFTTEVEATSQQEVRAVPNGEQEAVLVAVADADGTGIQ